MHKSYKYILIALTTVFIFCTIFSVQKVSANLNEHPILEQIIKSDIPDNLNLDSNLLGYQKDNIYYYVISNKKYQFYVGGVNGVTGFRQQLYTDHIATVIQYNIDTKQKSILKDIPASEIFLTKKEQIFYTDENIEFYDYVGAQKVLADTITPTNLNMNPFYLPPLQLTLEELPTQVKMGVMTILPVGLVVLSILLGIVLIPRLINYFRR